MIKSYNLLIIISRVSWQDSNTHRKTEQANMRTALNEADYFTQDSAKPQLLCTFSGQHPANNTLNAQNKPAATHQQISRKHE
jgi:hypothetical protein